MQRPTTPANQIGDSEHDSTPQTYTSPRTNPVNSTRRSSRASADSNPIDEPWTRPSIRIRRQPSTPNFQRTRAATVTNSTPQARQRAGSHVVHRASQQQLGVPGPPTPGTDGPPAETSSSSGTRRGSGSGSNRHLRRETRNLDVPASDGGRRRSSSDPPQMHWDSLPGARDNQRNATHMPPLEEGTATATTPQRPRNQVLPSAEGDENPNSSWRRMSSAAGRTYSRFLPTLTTVDTQGRMEQEDHFEADMVDVLDTIDPEVSTLNTLTNVQNSLFVPDLGRLLNRRPTYTLTRPTTSGTNAGTIVEEPEVLAAVQAIVEEEEPEVDGTRAERTNTLTSMTSRIDERHFAVLPHGERLEGWTAEDRAELDDHVRHLLHSRKEKFKRGWKGFRQYVSKPLGFFVTLYATLITLFGLAWVLFLIGWINVGGRKDYIVNIIDNVLVALFAIMGDGLAPFRAIDTYHMCFIAHYHHLTWRLRREQNLPKLKNHNDLPGLPPSWDQEADIEAGAGEKQTEYSVLNPEQQKRLVHHQKKFNRSHTFYKPHETTTHFAFPLRLLVAVVVLLDCHSCLQIALGTCTWAISYHTRPFALTTVILCCSITCNITAGVVISVGDHKTRKKDVLERMFRQKITSQAIRHVEKRKEKERQSMDISRGLMASGPVDEKTNDIEANSVLPTPIADGRDAPKEAISHSEDQANIASTKTTTATSGPTITTTTATTA